MPSAQTEAIDTPSALRRITWKKRLALEQP